MNIGPQLKERGVEFRLREGAEVNFDLERKRESSKRGRMKKWSY